MRTTWTAAAMTAACAVTAVTLMSAAPASAVDPDAVLAVSYRRPAAADVPPLPVPAPGVPDTSALPALPSTPALPGVPPPPSLPGAPSLPAVPDTSSLLGPLDGVLGLLGGVLALAAPGSGTPDTAALQQKVDELLAAVKAILAGLPVQLPGLRAPGS
ncbi:hypothetical protein [Kitasatospora sp. NBC_01539]|uniref:hypothetical protein n=1 Tax=Kitasatospora sp. NBC_01539 TaxID=2903577 RepID=UPI0038600A59